MTDRLYYEDSYLKSFEARVTSCEESQGGFSVRLDRSAFYPTSGGQPHDTGRIGPARVKDVYTDEEDEVIHLTDLALEPGETFACGIDWPRRFDHMQQHGGEHILAGSLLSLFGGYTHGLHIGEELCTIDVTMPDGRMTLTEEDLSRLGDLTNRRVQTAAPIRAWFPSADEIKSLPLRKEPTVDRHVRVVMAGDFECVACGGTHPRNTGEVGLILPLSSAPARGKLRLSFLCGMRALRYVQAMMASAKQAGTVLSAPMEEIGPAAEHLRREQGELRAQITLLKKENAAHRARALLDAVQALPGGERLIAAEVPDPDSLRDIAAQLIGQENTIVLLASPDGSGGERLLFARSADLSRDMAALLRACGARGGGRPDFAQGLSQNQGTLKEARKLLLA
jgi:alanyl-tRNA synthetase